ncbi:hypothetical protein E5206_11600 [Arthrobacter sp. PAMC25564]|nr:hypothetical protein E5206_11600 [Arthrobacter sp. PAMC25564]
MDGSMRRLLRASLGLCPRHTWAHAVVEIELWKAGAGARGAHPADRVRAGIRTASATAVLIKSNQAGTVSETFDTLTAAAGGGFGAMVSHRSGETDDTFVADLAVGSGCGQLKSGAPARGERVAKYNRLLEITDEYPELLYGPTGTHLNDQ